MLPEAGEIALRWFRSGLQAQDKGGAGGYDPVTIADRNIEATLRARHHGRLSGPRGGR